jgi:hypothetical protein
LVEGIFSITPSKFGQNEIRRAQQIVEDTCATFLGADVSEKILKWEEESKISGETLKKTVDIEVLERTREIAWSFEENISAYFPTEVENKGVVYKT